MLYENTPTIKTQSLILRKFEHADAQALLELLSDDEVNTFLPWFTLKSIDEANAFLMDKFLNYYKKPSAYRYAICLKENNRPVGYVWMSEDESHDFGYALKKDYWRKGIVTQASCAVVNRIKAAGYSFITSTHDINNPASGKVMEKLGMKYKYSYVEQWQPKNISVTFRMYQYNFDGNDKQVYTKYQTIYKTYFIEKAL